MKATIDFSKCDTKRDKKAGSVRLRLQELEYLKGQIKKERSAKRRKKER